MEKNLVLVLNCGSSSLKFAVLCPIFKKKYLFGVVDRLYLLNTHMFWSYQDKNTNIIIGNNISHQKSLKFLIKNVLIKFPELTKNIKFIGHRVVHGGYKLKNSVIITDSIVNELEKNIVFAPLHNPINLLGIKSSIKYFPELSTKNVAVLDTAFYFNMPECSYLYAIPYKLYEKHHIRRYGAHGISHSYVAQKASEILNIEYNHLNIITCHLGGGSSVTAICNGVCVDTSMGLTPLEGLAMGTRSGDLDPSIIFFMHDVLGMTLKDIKEILMNKSGMLGLTNGITSDFRYIEEHYYSELESYRAMNIYCHRLSKYISAYTTLLNGKLDGIVFTGGIGENSVLLRQLTLSKLSFIGLHIDHILNRKIIFDKIGYINVKNTTPVLVIPTNEELMIAEETIKLFS